MREDRAPGATVSRLRTSGGAEPARPAPTASAPKTTSSAHTASTGARRCLERKDERLLHPPGGSA